jgi:uncharacterized protein
MNLREKAIVFPCGSEQLMAIVNRPSQPLPRGVLVIVGGPQYRVGSHRQFTLLCRALAGHGIASMRVDYRGMGDSQGAMRNFEDIESDIRAASDQFCVEVPEVSEVVIWGLCDAASAALMYAHKDQRVTGLVLLNPWVRTIEGLAKAQIKHYYWSRLSSLDFWRKLLHGRLAVLKSLQSFVAALARSAGMGGAWGSGRDNDVSAGARPNVSAPLPDRMADGLSRFKGRLLIILSGNDLTAQEFEGVAKGTKRWVKLLAESRVQRQELAGANHTFSRREWRDQVAAWTADWVRSW